MSKNRLRCTHCGTEGNGRTQRALSGSTGYVNASSCIDKMKCNARLRAARSAAARHETHVNTQRAKKQARRTPTE